MGLSFLAIRQNYNILLHSNYLSMLSIIYTLSLLLYILLSELIEETHTTADIDSSSLLSSAPGAYRHYLSLTLQTLAHLPYLSYVLLYGIVGDTATTATITPFVEFIPFSLASPRLHSYTLPTSKILAHTAISYTLSTLWSWWRYCHNCYYYFICRIESFF